MKEITEAEKLLLQVANMSCGDLPLSTQENHKNIWAAFYAGIAWQEACLTKRAADGVCSCGSPEFYNDKVLGVVCCRCQAPRR